MIYKLIVLLSNDYLLLKVNADCLDMLILFINMMTKLTEIVILVIRIQIRISDVSFTIIYEFFICLYFYCIFITESKVNEEISM